MSVSCSINKRMKEKYENTSKYKLVKGVPAILRVDGIRFSKYTKNMDKPFDNYFNYCMQEVAKKLCKQIQGVKLAYTQSDEVSVVITDYDNINTQPWVGYNISKMTSHAASIATSTFNRLMLHKAIDEGSIDNLPDIAMFDARVFNVPTHEVNNYLIARQRDCIRNSVNMFASSVFSHNELLYKNTDEVKEMCLTKNMNWDKLDDSVKYGSTIVKNIYVNDEKFDIIQFNNIADVVKPKNKIRSRWDVEHIKFNEDKYINKLI